MKVLLLLLMITACAALTQDLSGKMFTFPLETNRAYVKFNTSRRDFDAITVCLRSFTDLKRDHGLFSLSTPNNPNDFLIFWDNTNKEMEPHIKNKKVEYGGRDYKPNTWHSICITWDGTTGLTQLWFNGQPSVRKFTISGSNIGGPVNIIVGQVQFPLFIEKWNKHLEHLSFLASVQSMNHFIQFSYRLINIKTNLKQNGTKVG
uniref:Pentraxin family member n=1 Tax=Poecilia mexicana TaxID=48701 RepID=A0A3B3YYA6_9TELE